MIITIVIASIASILLVKLVYDHFQRKTPRIPTVSPRWPLVGNALHLDLSQIHKVLTSLSRKYGPIYEVKLFKEVVVVLNDYHYIAEALVARSTDLAGRPQMKRTKYADRNKNSLVWQTYTPQLVFMRKEIACLLRPFGSGSPKLELKCYPEIRNLIQQISCIGDKPFDPWDLIFMSVANMMLSVLIGERLDSADKNLLIIKDMSAHFNKMFGSGEFRELDFVPWKQTKYSAEFKKIENILQKRDDLWNSILENNLVTNESVIGQMLPNSSHNDVSGSSTTMLTPAMVKECFTNLILAGTDTTTTAITCLLLILMQQTEVQSKMHEEIDDVIGDDIPRLEHKCRMPYTQAVLLELLRYISHIPLAIPHCSTKETSLGSYHIPQNRMIYINLWAMHHDPDFWHNPWKFSPDRFLDDTGAIVSCCHENRRRLMPFGAGRRVCVGERLAQARLFLFVTSLFQNFVVYPEIPNLFPDMDPRSYELGIVLHPKQFKIRTKMRKGCVTL